ncbi:hypothetical protein U9M48_042523 [Paspalum notatum var. saurae]|uniref:Uncharacterized protein n=1 Tax=Paspalum notatum var. saurae TaxID=547442 RepID=A0AAQ3URL3_PASNO
MDSSTASGSTGISPHPDAANHSEDVAANLAPDSSNANFEVPLPPELISHNDARHVPAQPEDKRLGFSYCLIFTRHSSRASGSRASKDAVYHQPLEVPIGIKQVRDGRGTGEALPIMYDANMDSDRN